MSRHHDRIMAEARNAKNAKRQSTRRSFSVLALGLILCISFYGINQYDQQKKNREELQILVNASHLLPQDFTVNLKEVSDNKVDERMYDSLIKMLNAAEKDGISLSINSAYRSVKEQRERYEEKVKDYQQAGFSEESSQLMAQYFIASPGASEHHTGLAVDFVTPECPKPDQSFGQTRAYQWLEQHGAEYGFILRYPQGKEEKTGIAFSPWHYRYVGEKTAIQIKESGLCFEEFLAQYPQSV